MRHRSEGAEGATYSRDAHHLAAKELVGFGMAQVKCEVGGCPAQIGQYGVEPRVKTRP